MKEFKLEIDTNTKYINALRYTGAFIAGLLFFPMIPIILGADAFDWGTLYWTSYGLIFGSMLFFVPSVGFAVIYLSLMKEYSKCPTRLITGGSAKKYIGRKFDHFL